MTVLKSLFGHKAWANEELYSLMATLPADQTRAGIIRTLNHIYVVDRLFRARLAGEPAPFDGTNTTETPLLADLQREVRATDAWYLQYVAGVSESALAEVLDFSFTDGDKGRMSREEMLVHVITHGAYHRGNVSQMLKAIPVVPPRDLYTKFLHQSEPARRA